MGLGRTHVTWGRTEGRRSEVRENVSSGQEADRGTRPLAEIFQECGESVHWA